MAPVIGLGAGGHAKVVIEILRAMGGVELIGLLDVDESLHGKELLDVPVLGNDDRLAELTSEHGELGFFLGVGSVGDNSARTALYRYAVKRGAKPVSAVHPAASLSPSATFGQGITVAPGVVVHPEARFGENVLLNTGCLVEHDCVIGDHCVLSPRSSLMGGVTLGEGSFVGAGAVVLQGVTIGDGAVIGAGAVVRVDVPANSLAVGNPAQIRER